MSNRHSQITIVLNQTEMAALRSLSDSALRRPKDQARYILRQALGLTDDRSTPSHVDQQPAVSRETPVIAQ